MLPLLRKSTSPRIVNVASQAGLLRILPSREKVEAFTSPTLTVDEISDMMKHFIESVQQGKHAAEGWPNTCYGTSKLAVIALTRVLAKNEPGILINACCPGYCSTDMSSHRGTRSAEEGARTPAFLAMLPDGGPTGKFFYDEAEINW
jgi:carbonyl reductase 1